MYDLQRKWGYFHAGRIVSILTTVPLSFGWGSAIGIAGVATTLPWRGRGLARALLGEVLRSSELANEGPALLFAKQTYLYEQAGFKVLDRVIRARIMCEKSCELDSMLEVADVERIYDAWASNHPFRLRRNERRWNYWKWNLRVCCPFAQGYVCLEGATVRECIFHQVEERMPDTGETRDRGESRREPHVAGLPPWPVQQDTEWLGLESMADRLRIPLESPAFELHLMGFEFDECPQMFLTDQF